MLHLWYFIADLTPLLTLPLESKLHHVISCRQQAKLLCLKSSQPFPFFPFGSVSVLWVEVVPFRRLLSDYRSTDKVTQPLRVSGLRKHSKATVRWQRIGETSTCYFCALGSKPDALAFGGDSSLQETVQLLAPSERYQVQMPTRAENCFRNLRSTCASSQLSCNVCCILYQPILIVFIVFIGLLLLHMASCGIVLCGIASRHSVSSYRISIYCIFVYCIVLYCIFFYWITIYYNVIQCIIICITV